MNTTTMDRYDITAYRSWATGRVAPKYLRGIPTWVWESAYSRRQSRRPAASGAIRGA